jgi:hypothetical protein
MIIQDFESDFLRSYMIEWEIDRKMQSVDLGHGYGSIQYPTDITLNTKMTMDQFRRLVQIHAQRVTEEQIRDRSATVAAAYEQYQMLLTLAK